MSFWTGKSLRSAILGLVLTLGGLVGRSVLLHTEVKPHFEPYASYFVEARGWPFAWACDRAVNCQTAACRH